MKTILVTGSNGLLGQKIIYALRNRQDVVCISTSRGENRMREKSGYIYDSLDITDANSVDAAIVKYKPDSVINTAAMTSVDACEKNRDEAWEMNVAAVKNLISSCKKVNAHLVHLSTDFVFDGNNGPYVETDEPNPLSFYGHTKFEAEQLLMNSGLDWAILRTIIIYGVLDDNSRSNVVLWTINSLKDKKTIHVINDQFRSPTLAEDLADACVSASMKKATGIYHVSGIEVMNILDIVKIVADFFKLDPQYIHPISSASLNQPAKRPPVTGFIIEKAMRDLNYHPHTFIDGLSYLKNQLEMVVK